MSDHALGGPFDECAIARRRRRRIATLVLAVLAPAALALAPCALGASVKETSISGGSNIEYDANPGEANDLGVLFDQTTQDYTFREFGSVPLTAATGCTQVDPQRAKCPGSTPGAMFIILDDQGDRVRLGASHGLGVLGPKLLDVFGGDGNDILDATFVTANDLHEMVGNAGDDSLTGGAGNDFLEGGSGVDSVVGGAGIDEAGYGDHATQVVASLDGVANDGSPVIDSPAGSTTPSDNVATDVEGLIGGSGNDRLTGDAGPNTFFGLLGSDVIRGLGGADILDGQTNNGQGSGNVLNGGGGPDILVSDNGPDRMIGGAGFDTVSYENRAGGVTADLDGVADDGSSAEGDNAGGDDVEKLVGGSGDDTLKGNDQANRIVGGAASDVLRGLGGDDSLFANDGIHDSVGCGAGTDQAKVDLEDGPAGFPDCETVQQAAISP